MHQVQNQLVLQGQQLSALTEDLAVARAEADSASADATAARRAEAAAKTELTRATAAVRPVCMW